MTLFPQFYLTNDAKELQFPQEDPLFLPYYMIQYLQCFHRRIACQINQNMLFTEALNITFNRDIIGELFSYIGRFGRTVSDQFPKIIRSIIRMVIQQTTDLKIWSAYTFLS